MKRKFVFSFLVVFITLFISCAVNAMDYYVSSSEGNDLNDGLSDKTPWKTLKKLSEVEFLGGDNIYLKSGDVWNESFFPKGNSTSENWITLTSYGEGEKPEISPGKDNIYAIFLENMAGWRFINLEICNAQAGIRFLMSEPLEDEARYDGLWFEDLYVHDIADAPVYPDGTESGLHMSYGISTYKELGKGLMPIQNVTVKDCLIERTDAPACLSSIDCLTVENVVMRDNYKEGILFSMINNGTTKTSYMKNCKVLNTGYPKGMYWGVAGVQFNTTQFFEMTDCEVAYTKAPGCPDGCGVDFEGKNLDITMRNNYIHDNEGTGIMIYTNPKWGSDNRELYIIDNVIEYNGLKNIGTEQSLLRHKFNYETEVVIKDNKIKVFENQPVITYEGEATQTLIENGILNGTWPTQYYTAENNTIELVSPDEYAGYEDMFFPKYNIKIFKQWNFKDGTEGFEAKNGLSALKVSDGAINADITDRDPYIYSPDDLGIDIDKNKIIKIRMKQTTTCQEGKVYFITEDDTKWNEAKARSMRIKYNDGEYAEYYVDMQYLSTWTGTLKQLRIDPIDNSGTLGEVAIDYVVIGENIESIKSGITEWFEDKAGMLSVVQYKNGVLKKIDRKEISSDGDYERLMLRNDCNGAKLMLWDNLDNMKPLCEDFEIKIE